MHVEINSELTALPHLIDLSLSFSLHLTFFFFFAFVFVSVFFFCFFFMVIDYYWRFIQKWWCAC